jgi:predicted transcriptional regulator
MSLTINLSPETERRLLARAAATGQEVSALVEEAVAEKLLKAPSFDEVCEPFRRAVEGSGVTDGELDALLEGALAESRRERGGGAVPMSAHPRPAGGRL